MMFDGGNLITLGIVALAYLLHRLMNKNHRAVDLVKKQAEKSKKEIAEYADEKSMAVKNLGINLDVERKAAMALMKDIQRLTEEELGKKSKAIMHIEEHINAFESSLDELTGMTNRVQENLNRIRDESVFVENTGKRVSEAKEKFEQVEKALIKAEKNLEEAEARLIMKNTETLEQTSSQIISSAQSIVSDFEATAQVIERRVEDHREALIKAERQREAVIAHDMEVVKKTFREIIENAGKRADKMEEAALVKLKEQAQERVNQLKVTVEEKIKSSQEALKNEQGAIQIKLKEIHDKWSTEASSLSAKQKSAHQEWTKNAAELESMVKKQKEEISAALTRQQEEVTSAITKERDTIKQRYDELDAAIKNHHKEITFEMNSQRQEANDVMSGLTATLREVRKKTDDAVKQQQSELTAALGGLKEKTSAAVKQQQSELTAALGDLKEKSGAAVKQQQSELAAALSAIKENSSAAVKEQEQEFAEIVSRRRQEVDGKLAEFNKLISAQQGDIDKALKSQMESWKIVCRDTEQSIIAATERRLGEYSRIQNETINQLSTLADDAGRLDNELRLAMQEVVSGVKNDFSVFEKESNTAMETASAKFNAQAQTLRSELEEMDKQLDSIRQQAFDNVSEHLSAFEKNFTVELGKRTTDIGMQITDWQGGLEERFQKSSESILLDWQQAEERIAEGHRRDISALNDKLSAELGKLKKEASAFEENIRQEMNDADEARSSFAEQIRKDMIEIRGTAESEVKTQIGQYQISMQETLRQRQRELEKELEEITARSQEAHNAMEDALLNSRQNFDEWQEQYKSRMREMDVSLEEIRRHSRETAAENDERIVQFRQNLDDVRKELGVQKKTFDRAVEHKHELERRIEELQGEISRLDQRKNEVMQLEAQFNRIKRLEDEVNNKMTRFINEKTRIDQMKDNFDKLIRVSQSVEERLSQVTNSDEVLQAVQVRIRKLEEGIKETDEKFQRIERKNEVLDVTNESIDRNFKDLQKTENAIKTAENIISKLMDQFENLRISIEALAAENEKAADATDKIAILDSSLTQIEQRIADMNVAREWLARTETELKSLDKDIRTQLKLTKSLLEEKEKKGGKTSENKGAPPPQDRDNVMRLKSQGWTVEEIANAMNMSRGEVELILEISSRG